MDILFTMDENFAFSRSFAAFPPSVERAEEGTCSHRPGEILGLMYTLCPLNLKHCSSKVETIGKSQETEFNQKSRLNVVFEHL